MDLDDSARGSLLIMLGSRDHTVPEVVSRQAAGLYRPGMSTRSVRVEGKGHSLALDHGWRSVADQALAWIEERVPAER